MRRLALAAIAAALAILMLAIPASARVDHHFSVDIKGSEANFGGGQDRFHFHAPLAATFNRDNQVGNLRFHCRQPNDKLRCTGVLHLNGDVGGFGALFIRGNLGTNDDRLNITGGTGDFEGAAGKIVAPKNRLHIHLVR
jgi:hypothetical protein